MALILTELNRFPVKSCRGEQLRTAVVEPWGLAGDRRWMLVDQDGETVTAREHRQLLLVRPRLRADGGLDVAAPDRPALSVARPVGDDHVTVTVYRGTPFAAAPAGDEAHHWFSSLLGKPVRLVYSDDPRRRPASETFAGPGVPLAFGDGYPLLLTTEASLAALNDAIAEGPRAAEGPLPMVRFRPNVVVSGDEAWAEDGWRRLRIGAAVFRAVKGCDRCALAATDAETALRGKEPTATLARHRRWDGAVWFGMNVVPETPGAVLTVGDEVELLETVAAPDGPPR
jgi:MOSC domain-containing protein